MRADSNFDRGTFQSSKPLHRHAQLRWRTSPEQIGRSRRNYQKVRCKSRYAVFGFRQIETVGLRVDQQCFMSSFAQLACGEHEFQRNMRISASEVGRSLEVPVRIDQGKLHPTLPENSVARAKSECECTAAGVRRWVDSTS